jgi:hypothetical protein
MSQYAGILQSLIGSLQPPRIAGGGSPLGSAYANMLNQANAGNAQRGSAILQLLDQQGESQKAENQDTYTKQAAGIDQDMVSRGLFNTTIGSNLKQEAMSQMMNANQNVSERAASNLANMANSFSQQAPNMGLLANLMGEGGSGASGRIVSGPNMFDPIFGLRRPGLA